MLARNSGSELVIDEVVTNGIRSNGRSLFDFRLSGRDVYDLLKLAESSAIKSDSILEVRKWILLSLKILNQARRQGF